MHDYTVEQKGMNAIMEAAMLCLLESIIYKKTTAKISDTSDATEDAYITLKTTQALLNLAEARKVYSYVVFPHPRSNENV